MKRLAVRLCFAAINTNAIEFQAVHSSLQSCFENKDWQYKSDCQLHVL